VNKAHILTTVILLVATGCAGMDYVRDAPGKINQADWSTMKMVAVSLTEHSFSPPRLVFKRNTPYKLELKNIGKEKHYFVSEGFFKAVALRKVLSADGEVKAPYLTAIEVYPGRFMELYFVPVREGTYGLSCTIEGHAEKGMVGKIVIEDRVEERKELRPLSY
jgi:uncharacterized cupredoxin-like copper-binding protein